MGFSTDAIHVGQEHDPATGAIIVPIYQTSTYVQEKLGKHKGYEYSRTSNPTRAALERNLARLEGGQFGFAFASGMAAINAILTLFKTGDHIITGHNVYGGTFRLFERVLKNFGFEFTYVDTTKLANVQEAIRKNTRLLFLETPTNPLMEITDLAAASKLAHERDVLVAVELCGVPLELMTDNGTPFVAVIRTMLSRFQRTLAELAIRHIRTQIDTPWTNGKIEAFWKTLQAEVLDRQVLEDLVAAEPREGISAAVETGGFAGVDGKDLFKAADRFGEAPPTVEGVPLVVKGIGGIRHAAQCLIVHPHRVLGAAEFVQDVSHVDIGLGEVGLEFQGALEMGQCLFIKAETLQQNTVIMVKSAVTRIELQGLAVQSQGFRLVVKL